MSGDARDPAGRFRIGHRPLGGGRPRGFKGVATEIMKRTEDGTALVDFAMQVWQDPLATPSARWEAFNWLSLRALGRPVDVSEMTLAIEAPNASGLPRGWAQLTRGDREQWLAVHMPKALASGDD